MWAPLSVSAAVALEQEDLTDSTVLKTQVRKTWRQPFISHYDKMGGGGGGSAVMKFDLEEITNYGTPLLYLVPLLQSNCNS